MLLKIDHVSKEYGGKQVLKDITLSIEKGSILGLLGPNGAGKTTLLRIITQIIAPDKGSIFFKDNPLNGSYARHIGYLPEERGLYKKMNVGEQLIYLCKLKGMSANESIAAWQKWAERLDIATWKNKNIETLSKGMQQKVQFAACVIHNPDLIILDEPFTGFDPVNAQLLKNEIHTLRSEGKTFILSTHRMESVEEICTDICMLNRAIVIEQGKIEKIKVRYASGLYHVSGKGRLFGVEELFHVIAQTHSTDDRFEATLHLLHPMTSNEFIQILMEQVELTSFYPKMPTMNDIFIKLMMI
ncbi:MAG: ATP-binding cassette domain-containing protein [Cytophagales bacterium]|nr:ATP-binding cassette domain-containing protein [Cytophagales bacterium]